MLGSIDSSLLDEWESLRVAPDATAASPEEAPAPFDLARHPRAFAARVRAELHRLVRALAERDYEEASQCVREDADDSWDPARFATAMKPFYEEYEELLFNGRARLAEHTAIRQTGPRAWDVQQVLLDSADDNVWGLRCRLELGEELPDGPIVRLLGIGP